MESRTAESSGRLQSLDALRGWNMFMLVGGKGLILALAAAFGLASDGAFVRQFSHVAWHDGVFWDFVYPLFVFISGVTYPFSRAGQVRRGLTDAQAYRAILKRTFLLVALGTLGYSRFLSTGSFFPWSVLGRIGFAWGVAAVLYVAVSRRARIFWCAGILVAYWLLLRFVAAPGSPAGADSLAQPYCLVTWLDRYLSVGHPRQYALSVLPMVSTAMLGMFAGEFLRWRPSELSGNRRALLLAAGGLVLVVVGQLWAHGLGWLSFPINKMLWSSSLVMAYGGYSVLLLAAFYWIIDVKGFRVWAFPFVVIGTNAILLYVASQGMVDFGYTAKFLFGGVAGLLPDAWGRVVLAFGFIVVYWTVLLFLYRRKIFFRV